MTGIFEILLLSLAGLMLLVMLLVVLRCCYSEAMDTWKEWRRNDDTA